MKVSKAEGVERCREWIEVEMVKVEDGFIQHFSVSINTDMQVQQSNLPMGFSLLSCMRKAAISIYTEPIAK